MGNWKLRVYLNWSAKQIMKGLHRAIYFDFTYLNILQIAQKKWVSDARKVVKDIKPNDSILLV